MSDIEFSLAPFASCVDEVVSFRNANRPIQRDHGYFEWRYRRRPCAEQAQIVWGADRQGRKFASASIIPHDFFVGDRVHAVGMLGDISVLPECRGQGVGTRMIEFLHGAESLQRLLGCLVLPNDEAASAFERAHWADATHIERFVRIVDIAPRLRSRLGTSRAVDWLAGGFNVLLDARFRGTRANDGFETRAHQTPQFDSDYDRFWDEFPKAGRILAVRNRAYLNWRYAEHPSTRHGLFELRLRDRLQGYVVFHAANDLVLVDDFLAVDLARGAHLVSAFVAWTREQRVGASIQVRWAGDASSWAPWRNFGFVRRHDVQRVMTPPPSAGASALNGSEAQSWFVSAGDKDV